MEGDRVNRTLLNLRWSATQLLADPQLLMLVLGWPRARPVAGAVEPAPSYEDVVRFNRALERHTGVKTLVMLMDLFPALHEGDEANEQHQLIDRELKRLFNAVLPNHPSVDCIFFLGCHASWVEIFAESFPSNRPTLEDLCLDEPAVSSLSSQAAVANMIRKNAPIKNLLIEVAANSARGSHQTIIDSLDGTNEHLTSVVIRGRFSPRGAHAAGAFVQALGASSRLISLETHRGFTEEGFACLINCLKTNEVLQRIELTDLPSEDLTEVTARVAHLFDRADLLPRLRDRGEPFVLSDAQYGMLEDLLLHYNCTLQEVIIAAEQEPRQRRINEILRLNQAARAVRGRQFRAAPISLLPAYAVRVGRMPSAAYRLVRANVDAVQAVAEDALAEKLAYKNLKELAALRGGWGPVNKVLEQTRAAWVDKGKGDVSEPCSKKQKVDDNHVSGSKDDSVSD